MLITCSGRFGGGGDGSAVAGLAFTKLDCVTVVSGLESLSMVFGGGAKLLHAESPHTKQDRKPQRKFDFIRIMGIWFRMGKSPREQI